MLPPAQVRHSLLLTHSQPLISHALRATGTAVLRSSLASNQPRRSFWGWRRNLDYTSHLDPLYHRMCRVRTLKTRAKLLKKLQRRGKFEWEGSGADFFTPKHVRWATRWDGPGGRRPWWVYPAAEGAVRDANGRPIGKEGRVSKEGEGEDDGLELSQREKIWKEQMERMRKRIESDPYEAIFGKRFEPFWSPLVPSWMREEMGLPVWKMKGHENATKADAKPEVQQNDKMPPKASPKTPEPPQKPEYKPATTSKADSDAPKSTSYAYASSTSWDSWSNKTRRVEWDSVSRQTKKYEYDPISNRMVQVEAPKPAEAKAIDNPPSATDYKANEAIVSSIPVKQSSELRKSIPIPPPLSQPSHSIPLGFSTTTTTTSLGPWKSTAIASDVPKSTALANDNPKPAAVAKVPEPEKAKEPSTPIEKGLESLTAEDVRANMGKPRASPQEQPTTDATRSSVKTQVGALLMERHISKDLPFRPRHAAFAPAQKSEWDKAELNVLYDKELENLHKKKEKLLNDERGLFHIERQKRELMKLDSRIKELVARVEKLNEESAVAVEKGAVGLQSSLDRMQSKTSPRSAIESQDPDDSAAHESTEPVDSSNVSNVPREWANQANLLQAARVRRSGIARGLYPPASQSTQSTAPSITPAEISARKKANEARRAADEAKAAEEIAKIEAEKARLEREQRLEKANAMLEDEIKEQKFRMQAHENRYAHKIRALRGELETAYKQSAVHGEKHLERIRNLEAELERAQQAIGEKFQVGMEVGEEGGDVVGSFTNWYREASAKMEKAKQGRELTRKQQQKRDWKLVQELKGIYENEYGTIDAQHQQPAPQPEKIKQAATKPGVVEVETNVDLGEALAKYEKEHDSLYSQEKKFSAMKQRLERQIAAQEREANEGIKLVDDAAPKLIPTELAKPSTAAPLAESKSVKWEIPPVYKVLAYDSGNDRISTATTTANFTGTETPISIPEALSQLYAPARFVGEFAGLQEDGYQVIYGSKDLLVFRKVAEAETATSTPNAAAPALEDHGLVAGENHPDHWNVKPAAKEAAGTVEKTEAQVKPAATNPVDGTSSEPKIKKFSWNQVAKNYDQNAATLENVPSREHYMAVFDKAAANHELVYTAKEIQDRIDDVLRKHREQTAASASNAALPDESHNVFDAETDWRHYPRVKREEYPHFTGSKRKWKSHKRAEVKHPEPKHSEPKYVEDAHKQPQPEELRRMTKREWRQERKRRERKLYGKLLGGVIILGGAAYMIGSAEEKSRKGAGSDGAGGMGGEEWLKKIEKASEKAEKAERETGKWMWK